MGILNQIEPPKTKPTNQNTSRKKYNLPGIGVSALYPKNQRASAV